MITAGHTFGLRLLEEGVHPRGLWEEEVRTYRNAYSRSSFYGDRRFPSGPYDGEATGRLRLELLAGSSMTFAERQRRWGDRASWMLEELVEKHRAEQLGEQARAFAESQRLRSYIEAMETAYGDHEETATWLAWAQSYVDQRDPLGKPPVLPRSPDATPEALQPHLPAGWNAEGPHEGPRRFPAPHQRT